MFYLSARNTEPKGTPMTFTATLPDFTVTMDRASHIVAEHMEGEKIVRTIDFGIFSDEADALRTWLEMEPPFQSALIPAMNAYLLAEFAARA
jgi:hypothetical protein